MPRPRGKLRPKISKFDSPWNFGRLEKIYGLDGPDGLIPVFGTIFWPLVAAIYILTRPFVWLYMLGRRS